MITVYGRKTSFNVQKVLWLLEELTLDFDLVEIGGRFGGLDTPEFVAMNPQGKVPVLKDGDKVIWESHSILRYLIAQYGHNATSDGVSWYHTDPFERSRYERWCDWAHLTFQPAFMGTFWGFYRTPATQRDGHQIELAKRDCEACLNTLSQQLGQHGFLLGESLSLADVTNGAILYRLVTQGIHIELPDNVDRWYQRLQLRAGYKKWVMSDYTELKGRETF